MLGDFDCKHKHEKLVSELVLVFGVWFGGSEF